MLVSGMIIGTVFTLFVVPSIYMVVARTRRAPATAAEPVAGSVGNLAEAAS
jgi:multidrug efflux pump